MGGALINKSQKVETYIQMQSGLALRELGSIGQLGHLTPVAESGRSLASRSCMWVLPSSLSAPLRFPRAVALPWAPVFPSSHPCSKDICKLKVVRSTETPKIVTLC